jgi:ABC-type multidrug transport system ATPase subunit
VNRAIETLGLESYADRQVGTLSGGTCRKLSVAIALLPGTRVVITDEPSTGIDPWARRSLWSAIHTERTKQGRAVVLTTHSMEEAEAVCTVIGIILRGRLTCHGSVQHLKAKFSGSYHMTVTLAPDAVPDQVDRFAASLCAPGTICQLLDAAVAHRRTYSLGRQPSLGELFAKIESTKATAGVVAYTVNQATLEEIFLAQVKAHEGNDGGGGSK